MNKRLVLELLDLAQDPLQDQEYLLRLWRHLTENSQQTLVRIQEVSHLERPKDDL